jgi:hypothetical protein
MQSAGEKLENDRYGQSGKQQADRERLLSRNTAFIRENEIKAESSAIKSENLWSKFLQKQRSVSLHHGTILMMAGNLLMFILGSLCVPNIVNCLPSSSSLTPSSTPIGPSCSVKHNAVHYSDVDVPRPSCSPLPLTLSRHLQPLWQYLHSGAVSPFSPC